MLDADATLALIQYDPVEALNQMEQMAKIIQDQAKTIEALQNDVSAYQATHNTELKLIQLYRYRVEFLTVKLKSILTEVDKIEI